jgi:transcriptional regulator with XRE-family HTH domain
MIFTDKLNKLMEEKGISRNQLAIESGVPYTTIVGFYARGYENTKLSTLRALANYFNCTLDYLADDDVSAVVEDKNDEAEFMRLYENATPQIQKRIARKIFDSLSKDEE